MAEGNDIKFPKQLPSATHEVVVLLAPVHLNLKDIDSDPRSHELISYHNLSKSDEIRERVQHASIITTTTAHINAESLGQAPRLKRVITPTAGINHIDQDECHRDYFAARRKTVTLHNVVRDTDEHGDNQWKKNGCVAHQMQMADNLPPLPLNQDVAGIIGYGNIGTRLATLCGALGMKVLISGRKGNTASQGDPDSEDDTDSQGDNDTSSTESEDTTVLRIPFDRVIKSATVLFISCVLNRETHHLIDTQQLDAMRKAIIINVARGGVLNAKAAFLGEDTKDLNLTLSPYVAYNSQQSVLTMKRVVKDHIKDYVSGKESTSDM
ncbi:Uu.00g139310.m01.CDS01 [Anthostomella pinea]|uniref:Uu.00g139310.m01.CDS01 n=1 Tax=Anthostomella pinea TaxID=933095 RepID=A0AAI8VJF6_9PEZI|nr:Uu.00g139310.m01.CDS01 [Anthostomella pinea]